MLKNIKGQFRYKAFQEIPESKLWEFVGPIVTAKDREILASWRQHFKTMRVPHVIIQRKTKYRDSQVVTARFLVCEKLA